MTTTTPTTATSTATSATRIRRALSTALGTSLAVAALAAPAPAQAQQAVANTDANTVRAIGSRAAGGLTAPGVRFVDDWELSLTWNHDGVPVRVIAPLDVVRGGTRSEEVDLVQARDTLVLRGAIAMGSRVELFGALPILLHQATRNGEQIEGPDARSSALGDHRVGARLHLFAPTGAFLWSAGAVVIAPTGDPELMFGGENTRLGLFTTIGVAPSDRYDIQLHTGFTQNDSAVIGDQIFGDFVDVSLLGRVKAGSATFMLGVLGNVVTADAPESASVERVGLEIEAGVRLFHDDLFLDFGGAYGAIDNGLTPMWRAQFALGVQGVFDHSGRDRDQDGVADQDDLCQHVAEDLDGFEDDDGCPEADNDGDGIADAWDHCPTLAEDMDGVADQDGCPENDADSDAILDEDDACPEAAEDYDGFEDTDGCPESGVLEVAQRAPEVDEPAPDTHAIYFDSGSAVLSPTAMEQLRQIAWLALESGRGLHIVGHADERGDATLNTTLSEQRANAARTALLEAGLPEARVTMSGAGSSQPIAPSTNFGLTLNRRVTFEWVD